MNRTDWIVVGLRLIGAYVCLNGLLALVAAAGLPKLPELSLDLFRFGLGTGATSALLGGALALFAARLGEWFERLDRGDVRLFDLGGSRGGKGSAPRSVHAQRVVSEPGGERVEATASPEVTTDPRRQPTQESQPMQATQPTRERSADERGAPTWSSVARTSRRRKRGPFERLLTNSTPGRDAIRARRTRRRKAADQRRAADGDSLD